jgi:putative membrane protein
MQFLKTLFWVILAIVLVLFARANWNSVTLNLWGGLQADVKLPALVIFAFLVGFLPTMAIYRTRLWSLRRRLETQVLSHVANGPPPARPIPVPPSRPVDGGAAPIA